jgi:hypothetical protein
MDLATLDNLYAIGWGQYTTSGNEFIDDDGHYYQLERGELAKHGMELTILHL